MAPTAPITHLLYLHGFRSSPQSFKARLLAARLAELGRAEAANDAKSNFLAMMSLYPIRTFRTK